jgi:hypothetical protein
LDRYKKAWNQEEDNPKMHREFDYQKGYKNQGSLKIEEDEEED